jgi:hypothetical protein
MFSNSSTVVSRPWVLMLNWDQNSNFSLYQVIAGTAETHGFRLAF